MKLKFRIWKYSNNDVHDGFYVTDDEKIQIDRAGNVFLNEENITDSSIVEPFTGLFDSAGNEIYVYDAVKVSTTSTTSHLRTQISEFTGCVLFWNHSYVVKTSKTFCSRKNIRRYTPLHRLDYCTIIGNYRLEPQLFSSTETL